MTIILLLITLLLNYYYYYYYYYYYIIIIIIIIIINIIIELTHSKTILQNTVEIQPQPVDLDSKNLSQYSSRFK